MDSQNTSPARHPALALCLAWLLCSTPSPAAPFSSLYAFGDGVCTTNGNTSSGLPYYQTGGSQRFCNGRVWIEVLATWLGLPYVEANNQSYFGQESSDLITNVNAFTAPPDVATSLFIIWTNDADLVGYLNSGASPPPYDDSDLPLWTTFINQAVSDHETAIATLYNKGVRTIVLPAAVDIGTVPQYAYFGASSKAFIRQRVIEFNAALKLSFANLVSTHPGLTIHQPDAFSFLDDVIAQPANYGLTVANIDAISDLYNPNPLEPTLDGPGANYVFWDNVHPTAKVQMHLAALVQQQICPLKITALSLGGGNTHLTLANIPLDRAGCVEGRDGPGPWQPDATILEPFATGDPNATIIFPSPTPTRLQRVTFPVHWVWP